PPVAERTGERLGQRQRYGPDRHGSVACWTGDRAATQAGGARRAALLLADHRCVVARRRGVGARRAIEPHDDKSRRTSVPAGEPLTAAGHSSTFPELDSTLSNHDQWREQWRRSIHSRNAPL